MRNLFIIVLILTLQANCFSQETFSLLDTTFQVGQVYRPQVFFYIPCRRGLSQDSDPVMDSLIVFLKKNDELIIEIGTHTDYRDTHERNLVISNNKALEIRRLLIEGGVDSSRLFHKGYGEDLPRVVDNRLHKQYTFLKKGKTLDEEYIRKLKSKNEIEIAHSINRRTEIKIIEIKKRP